MRKFQKQQILEIISNLLMLQQECVSKLEQKKYHAVQTGLCDCQEAAIQIGEAIEQIEGAGTEAVACLEKYCEALYQVSVQIESILPEKAERYLKEMLELADHAIKEIPVRQEAVFLPYKASMWDSLESVWMAADADTDCDAYVIPIPYYDRDNATGQFTKLHYEADLFPKDVPITHYDNYSFEQHKPDMIFIHNPYDEYNRVTSVHPFFYSHNLKKFTECLVYIPYFTTTGGMSEEQSLCPAYVHADYIVVQSEKYRSFYDKMVRDKILPLGSPKFDSIIRKCQNPPEPLAEWKERMAGKKVYFYNTSLNGMFANTEAFLKKMQYVFDTFEGREDVCLLWRPHPLMESSFASMRKEYLESYLNLKRQFIEKNLGIYDDMPNIEDTIAQCDVYIGDAATSVTSLFGVVGKPLFILNNNINALPKEDDWKGEVYNPCLNVYGDDRFHVTRNNQLWYSENNDYHYKFYMDLDPEHIGGSYYMAAVEIGGFIYVIPRNAQHLLIIKGKNIIKRIEFENQITQTDAFSRFWYTNQYIFIMPFMYHSLIRYNIKTQQITYLPEMKNFLVENVNGEWRFGASLIWRDKLVLASPVESKFIFLDMQKLSYQYVNCQSKCNLGTYAIIPHGDELWILPLNGMVITRWNPFTGEVREYDKLPENFKCLKYPVDYEVKEYPFGWGLFVKENNRDKLLLSPAWGNGFVLLDIESGEMKEWFPPIELKYRSHNGYFSTGGVGWFTYHVGCNQKSHMPQFYYAAERKIYTFDDPNGQWSEIEVHFDREELISHEPGYGEESEWIQYCCRENAFNTLKDLLNDTIKGNPFDKKKAISAFRQVNASVDGDCGKRIYDFMNSR